LDFRLPAEFSRLGKVGIKSQFSQFAGLSQAKLEFSFADIIENQTLAHPFDGIMGLTFPELSKSATKNPLMAAIDNSKYKLLKIFIVDHTQ